VGRVGVVSVSACVCVCECVCPFTIYAYARYMRVVWYQVTNHNFVLSSYLRNHMASLKVSKYGIMCAKPMVQFRLQNTHIQAERSNFNSTTHGTISNHGKVPAHAKVTHPKWKF
jgi:hypothetical protein